ncbi:MULTISPECIES: helix-turn-helix domain-containing protein [unclassified Thiocapsa]|uniref:helix-turn-helix domain-containing protein n=1 Tax=unclassified Thiocapsa TaxID=2641286 RepID=UPI0035B0E91B
MKIDKPASYVPGEVALTVKDVMQRTKLCRQSVYNEINSGRLKTFRVGNRRLVSPAALSEWVKSLERAAA